MQWPPLTGTLVPHEGRAAIGVWKGNPWWAPLHRSDWLAMGHTSKANIPEISVFYPSCHHVVGAMNNKDLGLWCRRGLLAYVYNGVFVWMNALVAGNGSYIVRPCGHDLTVRQLPRHGMRHRTDYLSFQIISPITERTLLWFILHKAAEITYL